MKSHQKTPLTVTYVPVESLKRLEANPRRWDAAATRQLKESIRRFGLLDPLIVNMAQGREHRIIGGNFRYAVAKELGLKEVPVVQVKISDPKREREISLRLNANLGAWNYELLKSFEVETLLDVGFDDAQLSAIWDEALGVEDDDWDVEKELEGLGEPTTKLGDQYRLGAHSLICADATDAEAVNRLTGRQRIDFIYTDPNYNISLSYEKGLGGKQSYGGAKTDDAKSAADYRVFLKQLLENGLAVAAEDAHIFFYCDPGQIGTLQALYAELGVDFRRVCLWIKNGANPTPQVAFNRMYEPVVYGTRGKPYLSPKVKDFSEIINKEIAGGNRAIDDVLDLFDIWLVKRDARSDYQHPTQKPPTLHERPLRRCSKPGDAVLDLTAGSGSTLVACEQLKRRAFLCEWEPRFCDLIVHRFEKLTGQKAELVRRAS